MITVPAYFGDEERRATVLAGTYAGLDVVDVLSEPIAAALSYGFGRLDGGPDMTKAGTSETVLVYDLGGGTFDATVIELADRRISVLAVEGDHQLGGADWDERIALHLSRRFCTDNPDAEDPLDDSARRAGAGDGGRAGQAPAVGGRVAPMWWSPTTAPAPRSPLTRAEVEEMTAPLLRRTVDLTRACLAEAARRGVADGRPACCWSAARRGCRPSRRR